jgi:hypothetical protein
LLLARWQLAPVRGEGLHAEYVLDVRVFLTEEVSQAGLAGVAGLAGLRRVQRGWLKSLLRQPGISQVMAADPQVPRKVALGRRTYPTCIKSSVGSGPGGYLRTQDLTRPSWRLTSSSHAAIRRWLERGCEPTMSSSSLSSRPGQVLTHPACRSGQHPCGLPGRYRS